MTPLRSRLPRPSSIEDTESGGKQRRHLPVLLAVATFVLTSLVMAAVWYNANRAEQRNFEREFDFQVREHVDRIMRRMATYEQVLRGTKGFLNGSIHVDRKAFHNYVGELHLDEHFPGIQGVGVAEVILEPQLAQHIAFIRQQGFENYIVWPLGQRDVYTSITAIEPFDGMNLRAFGFDMFSEPVRRIAMERSRDSGKASLSGKVTLVQEGSTDVQAGVLLYLPVYRHAMPIDTLEQRRAAILGWVYAPFRLGDFVNGIKGGRSEDLDVVLYDGESMSPQTCLYGCTLHTSGEHQLRRIVPIDIAGRRWTADIGSTSAFEDRMQSIVPRLIACGGVVASLLLALVVWNLSSGRSRAMTLALRMTRELMASHDKIASEQQRLRVILENSYDAFVAVDSQGKITDWNFQAERTFGWSAKEVIGHDLAGVLISEDQREAHRIGFRRFAASGRGPLIGKRVELSALRKDGSHVFVELAIAVVRTDSGYAANAFIRDLTERKETERREAERQAALEQARHALHNAQRLESVGKLTGGVAHDFNNLLQIISGNIQLMLHGIGGNELFERRLRNMMEAVDRGSKLSSQLLAFARRQPLQPQIVSLRQLLANIDDLLQRALGAEIEAEIHCSDNLWNTLVDPNQLENVILNLAINARDAMDGKGKLVFDLDNVVLDDNYVRTVPDMRAGEYIMLAVSDTGKGMAPDVLSNAFEPFFTTKPEGQGTGLGLSMAYGFIKQSGGHIQIYSELGHGTTVRIYLPRSAEPEQEAPSSLEGKDETVTGGSETILVVEDDQGVQETAVEMLRGLGYEVVCASDGEAALRIIRSGRPINALFTDVVMPGPVRSTDMVKAAKDLHPGIAVLYTSGYTRNAIVHAGRLDPGVHLLSKPYRREQLAFKLRQLLEAAKSSRPETTMH